MVLCIILSAGNLALHQKEDTEEYNNKEQFPSGELSRDEQNSKTDSERKFGPANQICSGVNIHFVRGREQDLDLIAAGGVPADADVVLLANPGLDLSAADAEHLRTYLAGGGRMVLLLDLAQLPGRAPQLEELLGNYGLGVQRLLVIEGDANRFVYNRPFYLLPKYEYHDIVSPLSSADLPLLMPVAMALKVSDLKKRALTIEALLSTSENSWGKVNYNTATTTSKEAGDLDGPFTIAYAVTDPATAAGARATSCTWPTAMACSPAAWARTTAPNAWAARWCR